MIKKDGQWKVVFPLEEELESVFQGKPIQLIEPTGPGNGKMNTNHT